MITELVESSYNNISKDIHRQTIIPSSHRHSSQAPNCACSASYSHSSENCSPEIMVLLLQLTRGTHNRNDNCLLLINAYILTSVVSF